VKEDRNIYLNGNRFLVGVSSIPDFIFQFVHTLKALLELIRGIRGRDLSGLLVEKTGVNVQPVASHGQTLSHNAVSSIPRH
jgi:hypothetical protein